MFSTGVDVIVDSSTSMEALRQVDDAEILWTACAGMLREQVSEAVWQTTFAGARGLRSDSHVFVLAVPSSVVRERIEGRYLTLVESSLADVGGGARGLVIEVHTTGGAARGRSHDRRPRRRRRHRRTRRRPVHQRRPVNPIGASNGGVPQSVNPRYTFDAFVTGVSNRFAHAAALSVAETPARSYNPLFIYGDAGLGKTHLLQAIAHYVSENYPASTVRYVSTETFMNQFVDAIRTNSPAEFKKRYREVDVLLLDDIQFLEGREGLQEELFHTFNALHQANHQIVLSSDRPPDAIPTLEDRLRSRFKMGLITEINPPDLETRLAILHKKAESEPISPPPDVLEFIATHITNNIRELEGALIRVCAYASLTNEELSVELAERVLADILSDSQPRPDHPGADPARRPRRCSGSASRRSRARAGADRSSPPARWACTCSGSRPT